MRFAQDDDRAIAFRVLQLRARLHERRFGRDPLPSRTQRVLWALDASDRPGSKVTYLHAWRLRRHGEQPVQHDQ